MSAVAEREAASLEELQVALEQKQEQRQALLAELVDLSLGEDAARAEFLKLTPDKDPYAVGAKGTQPLKIRQKREKVERQLKDLEATIGTLTGHINREGALRDVESLKAKTAETEKLSKADDALVRKAGKILAEEFLPVWNKLAENYEAREALRGEVERSGLLASARFLDPEAVSAFEQTIDFPGPRIPVDIGGLLEMLLEMCFDSSNHGYREAENGGDRRYGSHLPKLVPDLKGQDRRPQLSARTTGRVGIFGGGNQPGSNFTLS